MNRVKKLAVAFLIMVFALSLAVMLTSCNGFDNTIKDFLKSNNYTVETEFYTLKVDGATVCYSMNDSEIYLYYDKEEGSYFYCTVSKASNSIVKLAIDSEEYINYHTSLVSPAGNAAAKLNGFLQIKEHLDGNDEEYVFKDGSGEYTVSVVDGEILYKADYEGAENDYSYKIYDMENTVVEIPDSVRSAKAVEQ